MSRAYYRQIADWCAAHGVAMTGHPEKSTDIGYLQHFTIPCQDIVWRYVAPEEGKSDHRRNTVPWENAAPIPPGIGEKRRNGNECFGCCGAPEDPYRFTMEDMKWYLDWLFVRGVNMIFPHAFIIPCGTGERRKDRRKLACTAASGRITILLPDYIKRMCGLLTDSVNQAKAAVLCRSEELSWEIAKPCLKIR